MSNHNPTRAANWGLRRPMCRSWAHFLRLCSPFRSRKTQATFDQKPSIGRSVAVKPTLGSSKPIGSPRSRLANALTVHAGCVGASAAGDIGTNVVGSLLRHLMKRPTATPLKFNICFNGHSNRLLRIIYIRLFYSQTCFNHVLCISTKPSVKRCANIKQKPDKEYHR